MQWDWLWELLVFAGKTGFVVVAVGAIVVLLASMGMRRRAQPHLEVERLDQKLKSHADAIMSLWMKPRALKKKIKAEKTTLGDERSEAATFVLDFKGDLDATQVEALRYEVSAIIMVAREGDEVVVRLESPGGSVHGYGLAASQLLRLKQAGLRLVVCVDKVAASGGYMMAAVADEIVAAPFAVVGSIGVLAMVPNVNRWLQDHKIDYEEMTAGEYKRTISALAEIKPEGRAHFQAQLEDTHVLFKGWVGEHRPSLDIDAVASGEHWYGTRALERGLVDSLSTSDDCIMARADAGAVYRLEYKPPKRLAERLAEGSQGVLRLLLGKPVHELGAIERSRPWALG